MIWQAKRPQEHSATQSRNRSKHPQERTLQNVMRTELKPMTSAVSNKHCKDLLSVHGARRPAVTALPPFLPGRLGFGPNLLIVKYRSQSEFTQRAGRTGNGASRMLDRHGHVMACTLRRGGVLALFLWTPRPRSVKPQPPPPAQDASIRAKHTFVLTRQRQCPPMKVLRETLKSMLQPMECDHQSH